MTEPRPADQYMTISADERKIILRLRQVKAGIMTIEVDGDSLKWSVAGFWECPAARRLSGTRPFQVEFPGS